MPDGCCPHNIIPKPHIAQSTWQAKVVCEHPTPQLCQAWGKGLRVSKRAALGWMQPTHSQELGS